MVKSKGLKSKGLDETFNAVVVTREDLTNFETYNEATQEEKDIIWQTCKNKLPDMLLQDYGLCIEYCISRGLEIKYNV